MIASPRDRASSSATRRRSLGRGADHDDLGAVGLDARPLDRRRVGRHHDRRRDAEQAGRPRDALRVVARRVGDQAAGALVRRERRGRDVRAADLERADRLQRLGLEPLVPIRGAERDERRPEGDAPERGGRRADVVDRDEVGRRVVDGFVDRFVLGRHLRAGVAHRRRAERWQSMHSAADGSASSRSGAIGLPHDSHRPYVPASRRARAASTAARCCSFRSRSARSRCCSNTWRGRGRLRPVGHLPRALDLDPGQLGQHLRTLGEERGAGIGGGRGIGHAAMLRRWRSGRPVAPRCTDKWRVSGDRDHGVTAPAIGHSTEGSRVARHPAGPGGRMTWLCVSARPWRGSRARRRSGWR